MGPLLLVAGTLLLIGGLGGVWTSVRARRRGDSWRGDGLTSVALTLYGVLTLTGAVFNGTATGAVIVWAVAAATWTGLWIARRERHARAQVSGSD